MKKLEMMKKKKKKKKIRIKIIKEENKLKK